MKKLLLALSTGGLLAATTSSQQPEQHTVDVVGRLFDPAGQPAEGVPVFALADDDFALAAAIRKPLDESDAQGSFAVRVRFVADRPWFVSFGGRRFAIRRVPLRTDSERIDVGSICLAHGFVATGRVRTADGKPAAGAKVTGSDLLQTRMFMMSSYRAGVPEYLTRTIAGADGVFRLPGMLRSAGHVRVQHAGCFDADVRPVALGAPLDVTLRVATPVRGRVVDEAGQAVAGFRVECGGASAITAADGTFELRPTKPNASSVAASLAVDGEVVRTAQPIGSDRDQVELKLPVALPVASPCLQVQARGRDGQPVERFVAYVHWHDQGAAMLRPECTLLHRAAASRDHHARAEDGTAVLAGPLIPSWRHAIVYVRAEGHGWGRVETTSKSLGKPLVVDLPEPVTVRGRIVDSTTGAGIAGMTVVPSYPNSPKLRKLMQFGTPLIGPLEAGPDAVETDAQGRFELRSLPPAQLMAFVADGDLVIGRPHHVDADPADPEVLFLTTSCRRPCRGILRGDELPGLRIRRLKFGTPRRVANRSRQAGVPIGPDQQFDFGDVAPNKVTMQAVLPLPARGFINPQVDCGTWRPGAGADVAVDLVLPTIATVRGKIHSEVPWSRLAVLAFPLSERNLLPTFAPDNHLATAQPDGSYRLRIPATAHRLVLLDTLTGVALSFRDFDPATADDTTNWTVEPVAMRIDLRGVAHDPQPGCHLRFFPEEQHWPMPPDRLPGLDRTITGMETHARAGERLTLWFPARIGRLQVQCGGQLQIALNTLHGDDIVVQLGDGAPRRQ